MRGPSLLVLLGGLLVHGPLASRSEASVLRAATARCRAEPFAQREGEPALLELSAPRRSWTLGERVRVELRVGFEAEFARERLVQLFPRELELPVQVLAPWLEERAGLRVLPPPPGSESASLVLGEEVQRARRVGERVEEGRTLTLWQLDLELPAEHAGPLVLGAPLLRFAHASEFRESAFEGRVPVDRREVALHGAPLVLSIEPLPEAGRPVDFSGAVGSFTLHASAEPRALAVGESLALRLRVEGEGNFGSFEMPRLTVLEGFLLRGRSEEVGEDHHAVTYDLAPRSARVSTLPAIAFPFYDPRAGAYRLARSEPIPIDVRPAPELAAPGADAPASARAEASGELAREAPGAAPRARSLLLVACAALAALAALAWVLALRRRAPRAESALAPSAALRALHAALAADEARLDHVLADYLAARIGSTRAAVIGSELGERLERAGLPEPLCARAAALLEALVGARFGGSAPADARARVAALAEELERAFPRPASRRGAAE